MTSLDLEISDPVDSELFDQAIRDLENCDFLARLFRKDPSIWSNDPEIQDTIAQRLGWLDAPERAQKLLPELRQKLSPLLEGQFQDLLFLGMGGSSAFARILEGNPQLQGSNGLRLTVLDSLIPDQVHHTLELMAAPSTLIIVASKSGGTVETLSLAEIAEEQGAASRMIAITDPGTSLETGARERGYWGTFLSWSDVGGRFSALTAFGLVPAILVGMDLEKLVTEASEFRKQCMAHKEVSDHPGVAPGAQIGASIRAGTDILNLPMSGNAGLLAPLLEQLLAESLGKDGQGLWPLCAAPESSISIQEQEGSSLGAELFRWQIMTATIGALLGLNPFDEPDVGQAKTLARQALDQLQDGSGLPWPEASHELPTATLFGTTDLASFCRSESDSNELLSLLLYLPTSPSALDDVQRLTDLVDAPVMVGFGPRYLHTTGQLHKGGNDRARHLVVTAGSESDLKLSSGPMLSELSLAQALADVQALQNRGRTVAHIHLKCSAFEAHKALQDMLQGDA
jgi:hypothetical protein